MKKKNLIIASSTLAAIAIAGGALAFFTDVKTATNTFTVGDVEITLTEPNWNPDENPPMTPGQEVPKDPTVTNDGTIPAYVFMEVKVPYANVSLIDEDGNKLSAANNELFTYTLNTGWVEVGTPVLENGVATHVYAYGTADAMTEVAVNADVTLFNTIKFADVAEGDFEGENLNVVVKGLAIQTDNLDTTVPANLWNFVNNQSNQ